MAKRKPFSTHTRKRIHGRSSFGFGMEAFFAFTSKNNICKKNFTVYFAAVFVYEINRCRLLYENIVPSHTVYAVKCPDCFIRKFTNDGQYLLCFSRSQQELIVYRYKGVSYSCQDSSIPVDENEEFLAHCKNFDSYFTLLYTKLLSSGTEVLCKDFLLVTQDGKFVVVASSTPPSQGAQPPVPDDSSGADAAPIPHVPVMESITFHLISLQTGERTDQKVLRSDFVQLPNNAGVCLYEDLMAILSLRFQQIHILQILPCGKFVDVQKIGTYCHEDDQLLVQQAAEREARFQQNAARMRSTRDERRGVTSSSSYNTNALSGAGAVQASWSQVDAVAIVNDGRSSSGGGGGGGAAVGSNSGGRTASLTGGVAGAAASVISHPHTGRLSVSQSVAPTADLLMPSSRANASDGIHNGGAGPGVVSQGPTGVAAMPSEQQLRRQEREEARAAAYMQHRAAFSQNAVRVSQSMPAEGDEVHDEGSLQLEAAARGGVTHRAGMVGEGSGGANGGSRNAVTAMRRFPRDPSHTSNDMVTNIVSSNDPSNSVAGSPAWSPCSDHGGAAGMSTVQGPSSTLHRLSMGAAAGSRPSSPPYTDGGPCQVLGEGGRALVSFDSRGLSQPRLGAGGGGHGMLEDAGVKSQRFNRNQFGTNDNYNGRGMGPDLDIQSQAGGFLGARMRRGSFEGHEVGGGRSGLIPGFQPVAIGPPLGPIAPCPPSTPCLLPQPPGLAGSQQAAPLSQGGGGMNGVAGASASRDGGIPLSTDTHSQHLEVARTQFLQQHFGDLVMLRLQFLDRQHLLIKYGSPEGLTARNSQEAVQQNAFLMLYNIPAAKVLAFYQNTSTVFCSLLERFHDAFLALSGEAGSNRYLSSFSNCAYMRDQLQRSTRPATAGGQASGGGGSASGGSLHPQIVRRILAGVPCPSQAHSPSPYFDMSLFQFDDKLISSTDQPKPFADHHIKFFSRRRRPNNLRFKIKPGVEAAGTENSTNTNKRLALYIFHPRLPFVISVQQVFMQASVINFHLRL
eukprot:jgi/Mesvir1/21050/Mv16541-RA.1